MSAAALGALARNALLAEVDATPKPGLVDRANAGAHTDMDHATFRRSADALAPYFTQFARIGGESAQAEPARVLPLLRPAGVAAEQAMLAATGGVNTHKGAIFSLGLLCAAAGRLRACGEPLRPEAVCACAAAFVEGICARELGRRAATKGERAFLQHGLTGVRGEAEAGFPSVLRIALPAYRAACAAGANENDALCHALLALIAEVPDTNVLTRLDAQAAAYARAAAAACLAAPHQPGSPAWRARLCALDADFIARRISPGGCADLLACAWFLAHAREGGGEA